MKKVVCLLLIGIFLMGTTACIQMSAASEAQATVAPETQIITAPTAEPKWRKEGETMLVGDFDGYYLGSVGSDEVKVRIHYVPKQNGFLAEIAINDKEKLANFSGYEILLSVEIDGIVHWMECPSANGFICWAREYQYTSKISKIIKGLDKTCDANGSSEVYDLFLEALIAGKTVSCSFAMSKDHSNVFKAGVEIFTFDIDGTGFNALKEQIEAVK